MEVKRSRGEFTGKGIRPCDATDVMSMVRWLNLSRLTIGHRMAQCTAFVEWRAVDRWIKWSSSSIILAFWAILIYPILASHWILELFSHTKYHLEKSCFIKTSSLSAGRFSDEISMSLHGSQRETFLFGWLGGADRLVSGRNPLVPCLSTEKILLLQARVTSPPKSFYFIIIPFSSLCHLPHPPTR